MTIRISLRSFAVRAESAAWVCRYRSAGMAIALAICLAFSAFSLAIMPIAVQAAQAQPANFAIPAGSLGSALDALAREGNVQVVYGPALVAGKSTGGLHGDYAPADALSRLLQGTGLTWKSINATTFMLQAAPPAPAGSVQPRNAPPPSAPAKPEPRTLQAVQVTGSLINNAQIQTATPVFTINAAQIRNQGFTSVEETLQNSVFSVGSVQGESTSSSFTQGAQTFSFFGLPPGYSLILVDGKPLAPFGELYNGDTTFHNLSNIPTSIIQRIDIVPGGMSSIYGSSAMAGVVNIITKSHMNGLEVSARLGEYDRGGRGNKRVTLAFGHTFGKLDMLGSFQYDEREPLWGYQRELTSGTDQTPVPPAVPEYVRRIYDYGNGSKPTHSPIGYISPPDGCGAISQLFDGSTFETPSPDHPSRTGTYCGSYKEEAYRTFSAKTRHYDGLVKLRYDLNSTTQLYADLMANYEKKRYVSSPPHWDAHHGPTPSDYIEDATTHEIFQPYMHFGPEELPGGMLGPARGYTQNNLLATIDVGANGQFGASDWLWDAYFMHNSDRTIYNKPLWLGTVINQFFIDKFLGPRVGIDPDTGLWMYNPDYAAFFEPISPEQSEAMIYNNHGVAKSWINNTRFTVSNASLFSLPGGNAGFAALIEGGNQAWYEPVDPNMAAGLVWGHAATAGGGRRQHQAAAMELNLPFFRQLTMDLSGREDRYTTDIGPDNDKFTWRIGLEYRPIDTLLIRGNYATSFKAPDMAGMFLGPSTSFGEETDYYQCALADVPNCDDYGFDIEKTHLGNPKLRPTTAKSWTAGLVWAPSTNLSFSADYLHIAIENETVLQSIDLLLQHEAQCRLGELNPVSPGCVALTDPVTGQIQRDQFGDVTSIIAYYANLANETVNSVNAGAKYRLDAGHLGNFTFRLAYNDILKHTSQDRPGDEVHDELADPEHNVGFKSIVNGSISWAPNERWHTTVYVHRYGSMPNFTAMNHGLDRKGAGTIRPWITYNWSLDYYPVPSIGVSLRVKNLFNNLPPRDLTNDDYPYYNTDLYNLLGREVSLEARIRFGGAVRH